MRVVLLALLLVGCDEHSYEVTAVVSSIEGGSGVIELTSGEDQFVCTESCTHSAKERNFTLTAKPDERSKFDFWRCNEQTFVEASFRLNDEESWKRHVGAQLSGSGGPNQESAYCVAQFSRSTTTVAELCANAVQAAAALGQTIDGSDPFASATSLADGIGATGTVLGERCDADTTLVTAHSATSVPAKTPEPTTNTVIQATQLVEHAEPVQLACDTPDHVAGACGPATRWYVMTWVFAESALELFPPPALVPTDQLQFSAVFDTDGSSANNYVASPQYANDFWLGTDTQLAATYVNGRWSLRKTVGPSLTPMPTSAVLRARGSTLLWVIPASELGIVDGEIPAGFGVRTSLFRHGGDYGIGPPHDWSGDVDPPVDQALYALP